MSLALTIFLFLVGLVLIIKGGDWFVDAAAWMAEASGMPKFLIGATIVSVATTLPEIIVSTMAAAEGSTDMAIGNAIGSVTANIGLIMAVSLLFLPAVIQRKQFAFKGALMVGSVVLLWALCLDGQLTVVEAVIVLLLFVAYIIENVHTAKAESRNGAAEAVTVDKSKKTLWKNIGIFVLGAACLVVGSRLLVDNGTELAKILGVSERVIAVTMVAIGTSLPELVTAITAIVKKQTSMSVGNILGANIIDVTVILPLCSFIGGRLRRQRHRDDDPRLPGHLRSHRNDCLPDPAGQDEVCPQGHARRCLRHGQPEPDGQPRPVYAHHRDAHEDRTRIV